MTATKRGKPINERADFIEISRRAGLASVESRRRIKARKERITELADALLTFRPTLDELANSYLLAYIELLQIRQAEDNRRADDGTN